MKNVVATVLCRREFASTQLATASPSNLADEVATGSKPPKKISSPPRASLHGGAQPAAPSSTSRGRGSVASSSTSTAGRSTTSLPTRGRRACATRLGKTPVNRLAAIEGKKNFRLAIRQVHVGKVRRPRNPHNLAGTHNVSRLRRNQSGRILFFILGGCGSRRLQNQNKC